MEKTHSNDYSRGNSILILLLALSEFQNPIHDKCSRRLNNAKNFDTKDLDGPQTVSVIASDGDVRQLETA